MTNTLELEIAIKRAGFTKRKVAKKMNLSEMGLYKKIHNITEFKASEIEFLTNLLDLEDKSIFFNWVVI